MIDIDDIDSSFCHWLAGFIDGEATFAIDAVGRRYQCRMALSLRSDDRAILEQIRDRTGLGTIYEWTTRANPAVKWSVASRRDTWHLAILLQRYPLRSKKKHDFEIWSQAVMESRLHHLVRDDKLIADLKSKLQDGRKFA